LLISFSASEGCFEKLPICLHNLSIIYQVKILLSPTLFPSLLIYPVVNLFPDALRYAPRFAENDINFAILSDLTDQDLKELGVPAHSFAEYA
jgi:hypothetical protein